MFELARGYKDRQMAAYSELQEAEFAAEANGYTATKHQREAGTGYFDQILTTITGGDASTAALSGSTEAEQFARHPERSEGSASDPEKQIPHFVRNDTTAPSLRTAS